MHAGTHLSSRGEMGEGRGGVLLEGDLEFKDKLYCIVKPNIIQTPDIIFGIFFTSGC